MIEPFGFYKNLLKKRCHSGIPRRGISGIHIFSGFPLKTCGDDRVFKIGFKHKTALLSKLSKVSCNYLALPDLAD